MNEQRGKLIVLYGINNLGKSTQAKLLVEKLKNNGYQAEYIKYPIYSLNPSGELLNDYLRNGNSFNLDQREAQIIYAFNRTQYQGELTAKLESGINIIAEDYTGTGIAWGIGANVDESFLKIINSHLIPEDLVFLFDGERFREAIENNHKHENDEDLITKVRWAHLKLREEYGWLKINANKIIEDIHEELWEKVYGLLTGVQTNNKTATDNLTAEEEMPKNNNYSGFKAVAEIINNHQAKTYPLPIVTLENNNKHVNKETADSIEPDGKLVVEKTDQKAKLPQKAHIGDAAYDLYANDFYSIPPYGQALVRSGIKMAIPDGYVGLIWDKSGLAAEGITTMGGVIDSNYRGEIKIIVKNLSEEIFNIIPGQKIAQILIQKITNFEISEEKITDSTVREAKGFGSSGKF